jgi:Macrophage migration inhibitory factor (MIF)
VPVLQLKCNKTISDDTCKVLQKSFAGIISRIMKKPSGDVMVVICRSDIYIGDSEQPSAFVDLRCSSGLTSEITMVLCSEFGQLLLNTLSIELSRIYVNFNTVAEAHAWRFVNGIAVCPKTMIKS